ncbi:MAG: 1-acyl-sn-glycerol-3-phosphate acyltransferase [Balneolaceae bacterium]
MHKNWFSYQLARFVMTATGLQFFYKKVIVDGLENLPKDKPVLFLPNHQNSFMDALLIVANVTHYTFFLTRAQAFNPPIQGKIISSMNMLPVYRVRDGLSSVTKNNEIFQLCIDYLKKNYAILIFPEANHDLRRRIRPLSKGFTRIAFDAEVQNNWEMDLHLIPVGLNYTEHRRSRNKARVVFGEPIKMGEFKEAFEENERGASNLLRSRVQDEMKKLTMHVPNLDHYPTHKILLDDLEEDADKLIDPKNANKNVEKIEEKASPELFETGKKVYEFAEKHDIRIKNVIGMKKSNLPLILFFPLYLFSWLNNLIPYQPVRHLLTNAIKDHAFDASIKFLVSLILFPLFWTIVSTILYFSGVPFIYVFGYFVLSMLTSIHFKYANLLVRNGKERRKIKDIKESDPEGFKEFLAGIKKLNEFRKEALS